MKTLSSPAVRLARGARYGFAIVAVWLLFDLRDVISKGGLSSNLNGFLRAQETGPSHGLPDAPHQEPVSGNQRDGDGDRGPQVAGRNMPPLRPGFIAGVEFLPETAPWLDIVSVKQRGRSEERRVGKECRS